MPHQQCRPCSPELTLTFGDLGTSPPCESYLAPAELDQREAFYPLHVRTCERCLLVQLLEVTINRNPHKHGMFPSGAHLPVHVTDAIEDGRSDEVVILPWNLRQEISGQLIYARDWGAEFVVPFPRLDVF